MPRILDMDRVWSSTGGIENDIHVASWHNAMIDQGVSPVRIRSTLKNQGAQTIGMLPEQDKTLVIDDPRNGFWNISIDQTEEGQKILIFKPKSHKANIEVRVSLLAFACGAERVVQEAEGAIDVPIVRTNVDTSPILRAGVQRFDNLPEVNEKPRISFTNSAILQMTQIDFDNAVATTRGEYLGQAVAS